MEQMPNEEIDRRMQIMAGYLNDIAITKNIVSANIVSKIDPETNIITGRLYTTENKDIAVAEMDAEGKIELIKEGGE